MAVIERQVPVMQTVRTSDEVEWLAEHKDEIDDLMRRAAALHNSAWRRFHGDPRIADLPQHVLAKRTSEAYVALNHLSGDARYPDYTQRVVEGGWTHAL